MSFVDINGREDNFRKKIKPHINAVVDVDGVVGIAEFNCVKYVNPTMEFLDTLGIGKGHFETMYDVYSIREYQFVYDFDKYKILFLDNGTYISYKEYCASIGARYFFLDNEVFFLVPKYKTFLTSGVLLISVRDDLVSFKTEAGLGRIKLYGNLYMETKLDTYEVVSETKPLVTIPIYNGEISEDKNSILDGVKVSDSGVHIKLEDSSKCISNVALIVYSIDGENFYNFFNINYFAWNRNRAVLDINEVKKVLGDPLTHNIDITAMYILCGNSNITAEETDTFSKLFERQKDFLRINTGYGDTIDEANLIITPLSDADYISNINFVKDEEYFESIKGISKRIARELTNEEYSKIREEFQRVENSSFDGYDLIVSNRFSQVVSIYFNGLFYSGPIYREDKLGLSKIKIRRDDIIATFPFLRDNIVQEINYDLIEIVVEPLFTRRIDLVLNEEMQYGDAFGNNISEQTNLIPVHEIYGLEKEVDLFVNGYYIRKAFYEYVQFGDDHFIWLKKKFVVNNDLVKYDKIHNVSLIIHSDNIYDRKITGITDITDKETYEEHSKMYFGGILISKKNIINLYDGKYLNADISYVFDDLDDRQVELITLKGNPVGEFLKDANDKSLIEGFIIEKGDKLVKITMLDIYNSIKNLNSTNTIMDFGYPQDKYSLELLQRTKFVYDIISIGKETRGVINCNKIVGSGIINKIQDNYPEMIDENGRVVLNSNHKLITTLPINETYEKYKV